MGKYAIGDKVKVKETLRVEQVYKSIGVTPQMVDLCGQTFTITGFVGTRDDVYNLNEPGYWSWQEDMLEFADADKEHQSKYPPPFKVGDLVRVKRRIHSGGDYRCNFTDSMAKLEGRILTIARVFPSSSTTYTVPDDHYFYSVLENDYNWSSGMLEPLTIISTEEKLCELSSKKKPSHSTSDLDLSLDTSQINNSRRIKSDKSVILKITHKSYKFK